MFQSLQTGSSGPLIGWKSGQAALISLYGTKWRERGYGLRQTEGKNFVEFGEIERKLARLSKILLLTVLSLNYFMCGPLVSFGINILFQ